MAAPTADSLDWGTYANPASLFQNVVSQPASDVTVLDESLAIIDSILDADAVERPPQQDNERPNARNPIRAIIWSLPTVLSVAAYLVLIVLAGLLKALDERGCGGTDEPECTYRTILGAPAWRWCLWAGIRGPLIVVSYVLVVTTSGLLSSLYRMSGSVIVFLLALRPQVSAFLVEIGWLVFWLRLMHTDYKDAYHTGGFFQHVYVAVYKFIVLLAIWRGFAVLRHAFKRWLSLKFYHRAHYKDMMDALTQEHTLSLLTKPRGGMFAKQSKVPGWSQAHFAALKFITHVLHSTNFQSSLEPAQYDELVIRLHTIRAKLLSAVSKKLDSSRESGQAETARAMSTMLEAALQEAQTADLDVVRIAMAKQAGKAWRAKAAHKPVGHGHSPFFVKELEEAAFRAIVDKHRGASNRKKAGRTYSSWASLGTLSSPDADMLKNATKLSWIEEQIRHNTLQVSYLADDHTSDGHKTSLKRFKESEESKIDTSNEARKLGYYLFWHLKSDADGLEVTQQDLDKIIPPGTPESKYAWKMLDRDGNGAVSLSEVVDRVVQIYKRRKNLAATLLDTDTVVQQCFTAVRVVSDIIWLFIALALYDNNRFASTWAALSATLLSFSFVFGNSIKQIWENAIYLFTTHPYSVGDYIKVGSVGSSVGGDTYVVKKITLNHLQLQRLGNAAFVMPIESLRTLAVYNISRSGSRWDSFVVYVDMDTTLDDLKPVALAVRDHISVNSKLFGGLYRCLFTQATLSHKLELTVSFDYSQNGTDLLQTAIAKAGLFNAVAKAITKAGIEFTIPHQKGPAGNDPGTLPSAMEFAARAGQPSAAAGSAAGAGGQDAAIVAAGVAAVTIL